MSTMETWKYVILTYGAMSVLMVLMIMTPWWYAVKMVIKEGLRIISTDLGKTAHMNWDNSHRNGSGLQYEASCQIMYLLTYTPNEDSDQPARSRSLTRIAQDAKFLHADNEDWSDAQACLSFCWAHMSEGRFSHVVAKIYILTKIRNAKLLNGKRNEDQYLMILKLSLVCKTYM